MDVTTLLMIFAFVFFAIATFGPNTGKFSLIAAGLAFWALAEILPALSA